MLKDLLELSLDLMKRQKFDCLSLGELNFVGHTFESFEITGKENVSSRPSLFFDLASLTKPLTLSSTYLIHPSLFEGEKDFFLLLNHCGGLPEGGRISKKSWKQQILSYSIERSPTLYSDFSSLRLMLEIEKKNGKNLFDLCSGFWDPELIFWKDIKNPLLCPITGMRRGKKIQGQVNDDSAFILDCPCSHAGLFATVNGLCRSLLNLDREHGLLNGMEKEFENLGPNQRFIAGWDRVETPQKTLAGKGASERTFGHLGFTGTSVWIDLEKKKGYVLLTNASSSTWFNREELNDLRREIGRAFWQSN